MEYRNLQEALQTPIISKVTTLDLSNKGLETLPEEIGKLTSLCVLRLTNNRLKILPKAIGKLVNLSTLDLSENLLEVLPTSLKKLVKLQRLYLQQNKLTALPDVFTDMEKLRILYASENQLSELPASISDLLALRVFHLEKNHFTQMPTVLYELPLLQEIRGFQLVREISPGVLQKFRKDYKEQALSKEQQKLFLQILVGNTKAVKKASLTDLLSAVLFTHSHVAIQAKDYLLKRYEQAYQTNPITSTSVVATWGKTGLKKTEIKEKLQTLGATYSPTITNEVTHIVVGKPSKKAKVNFSKQAILSETQLVDASNQIAPPFLLEADTPKESKAHAVEMLLSTDERNVAIGLAFFKAGGVPKDVITELYLVYKISQDKKNKAEAKKLLEIHAPKDVHKVMKDQSRLVSSAYNGKKKLYKVQTRYAQLSQSIDWLRVGFYLYKRFGKGLRFVLDHTTPNTPFKIEVLQALIEDNHFDYHKGYATYMPDYQSHYTYEHYTFAPFPKEVYQFTQLQGISIKGCRIAEIPAGIHQLTALEVLDLSGNFLKALPEDITQLKNLRKIDISNNEFDAFPLLLTQLPSLEEIKITYNRKRWEHNPLTIPDGVYEALPNCSIQTR